MRLQVHEGALDAVMEGARDLNVSSGQSVLVVVVVVVVIQRQS